MSNEKDSLQAAQACNRDVPNSPPTAQQDCRDVVNISLFFDGTGNNEKADDRLGLGNNVNDTLYQVAMEV